MIIRYKFLWLYDTIMQRISAGKILNSKGEVYKRNTIATYLSAREKLHCYIGMGASPYLDRIDYDWLEGFVVFLWQMGLCKNTVKKALDIAKFILRKLVKYGYHGYWGEDLSLYEELTTAVFTDDGDFKKFQKVDPWLTPAEKLVKDIYLIHCFLGMRFGDLKKFLSDPCAHIKVFDRRKYICLLTRKTSLVIYIPMVRIVEEILSRYNYHLPLTFTCQHYGSYIRKIAEQAGINDTVLFGRTYKNGLTEIETPKYKLMSSHTARRSFATNAYLAGIDIFDIMLLTGHTSVSSFMRYIRCGNLGRAIKMSAHPFFEIGMKSISPPAIELANKIPISQFSQYSQLRRYTLQDDHVPQMAIVAT